MDAYLEKIVAEFEKFWNEKMDFSEIKTVPFGNEGATNTSQLSIEEKARQFDSNKSKIRNEINRIIKANDSDKSDEIKKVLLSKLPNYLQNQIF